MSENTTSDRLIVYLSAGFVRPTWDICCNGLPFFSVLSVYVHGFFQKIIFFCCPWTPSVGLSAHLHRGLKITIMMMKFRLLLKTSGCTAPAGSSYRRSLTSINGKKYESLTSSHLYRVHCTTSGHISYLYFILPSTSQYVLSTRILFRRG